jgi:hypothetical protein
MASVASIHTVADESRLRAQEKTRIYTYLPGAAGAVE